MHASCPVVDRKARDALGRGYDLATAACMPHSMVQASAPSAIVTGSPIG
jgi:hypothetical protein